MPPPTTILTIPEEIRQEIISYFNYNDAWALKQTSTLFYKVVEIPTIQSFLAYPYGPSLAMLEDWLIIPAGYEACYYCHRLLPPDSFSRHQRRRTAGRQTSLNFNYATWEARLHYCIQCGVKNGKYERGQKIFTGFGDPGYRQEAVVACLPCGTVVDAELLGCGSCSACASCVQRAGLVWHDTVAVVARKKACEHKAIPIGAAKYLELRQQPGAPEEAAPYEIQRPGMVSEHCPSQRPAAAPGHKSVSTHEGPLPERRFVSDREISGREKDFCDFDCKRHFT